MSRPITVAVLTKAWGLLTGTVVSISAQPTDVCRRLSVLCSPVEVKVFQGVLQNAELTHNFRNNSEFKQSQVKADDDDDDDDDRYAT
jgi:hypothetical protein